MRDYLFAKQLIYLCLSSYDDLDFLGSLMKTIDSENLLPIWLKLSNDIDKWNKLSNKISFPMQKLINIAKNNNKDEYDKFISSITNDFIDECMTETPYDISKVFYELYKYKFKYVSKNHWYIYDDYNDRWFLDEDKSYLKNNISQEFCKKFAERAAFFIQKESENIDECNKEFYNKKVQRLLKIVSSLKKPTFINDVIIQNKCLFIDEIKND